MQFWQSIARTPPDQLVPVAQLAEELGFSGLTMADHLVRPLSVESAYPYAADGRMATDERTPYPDPWLLSTFLARKTQRLRFMPYVYIPALRDPFNVAKVISTAALTESLLLLSLLLLQPASEPSIGKMTADEAPAGQA